jgi:hypothetical protein
VSDLSFGALVAISFGLLCAAYVAWLMLTSAAEWAINRFRTWRAGR